MNRSYRAWTELIAEKKRASPKLNLVIRHDVDFDIHTARKMLEIEKEIGLSSVVYFDVHSPSYDLPEIVSLYDDFKDSHDFGIHINVAYDNETEADCYEAFDNDLALLRGNGIFPHSCVAHYYDERIIPKPLFHNAHVEAWSHNLNLIQQEYYPQAFHPLHFLGQQTTHLTDGGGILPDRGISDFLESLKDNDRAYLLLHPIHFERNGTDVIYVKKCGHWVGTKRAQEMLNAKLTPFLAMPLEALPHLQAAVDILSEILKVRFKQMFRIVDAGCGIGLLGAHLLHFNNLKYTAFDMEPEFVELGQKFFQLQGYCPRLYTANLYEHQPEGDILVFLGYEDCHTDYDRLLQIFLEYPEVLTTIASESMYQAARKRGKQYHYIGEFAFERKFSHFFEIINKVPNFEKRTLYHLRRRSCLM